MIEASIVTTCKGRKAQLLTTLPFMMRQCGCDYEIVVVDYGDPDEVWEHACILPFDNRAAVRVLDNTDTFNLNRARNYGARFAEGKHLAFVDADVFLKPQWLRTVLHTLRTSASLVTRAGRATGVTGTFAVAKRTFELVNGFDESLCGWGHDEVDFFHRCATTCVHETYDAKLVRDIKHSNELRMQYYTEKDKKVSHAKNMELAADNHEVNPRGFAKGRALYYRHPELPYVA